MQIQWTRLYSVIASIAAALLVYFMKPFGLEGMALQVIAIAVLMILLWISEAMPMAVVALIPLVLFPLFNINSLESTAASYANPVIFLFMGGFMLGLAIEKWNLHRRIALNIVRLTGTSGNRIILGFIIATGCISMWLSNTATTMMMFPIALSVVKVMEENHPNKEGIRNFALSVMISIALASNFGGIATIIGTPPNVAYIAFYNKKYGTAPEFFQWMVVCMPLSILLLASLYLVLVKWLYPNRMKKDEATRIMIYDEIKKLGPVTAAEKRVLAVFIATALLWITRAFINQWTGLKLDDNMIAILSAIILFIIPAGVEGQTPLLQWSDTQKMAWGILLLFGGGIALAGALEKAGLIQSLGAWFSGFNVHPFVLVVMVTFVALFISELMSNVAQVIVFAPVVTALATAMGVHPLMLGLPMTLAASCASMLPMGTPPNAIAFSSGYIKLKDMTKVGFVMNIISIFLITLFCWFVLPAVLK